MLKDARSTNLSFRRITVLLLIILLVLSVFSVRLFQIQIVQGEDYAKLSAAGKTTTVSVMASRGEIVDCNQVPLVSNRASYAVVLDYNYFPGDIDEQNECLLALIDLLSQNEEMWNDSLPIAMKAPFSFEENRDNDIAKLKKRLGMATYASAEQCLSQLVEKYALQEYTQEQQRLLAGVHYEMDCVGFSSAVSFTFAGDVSNETKSCIVSRNSIYPGVDVNTVPVREYVGGTTACHIIGTVGPIYAEEYNALKDKGYSYNDVLGKSGIEYAAEEYLRGENGTRVLIKNAAGVVLSEEEIEAPTPGQTVVLCLDSLVQQRAQGILSTVITELRANGAVGMVKDVKSGSVVMLDVSNGGVVACASWPDYDLSTYSQDYNDLLADPDNPLFNRALNGSFACGSVFKPGVALAAITDGFIDSNEVINCTYVYDYYAPDYTPKCMAKHNHLSVVSAIEKSCNFFFYETGRRMGSSIFNYLFAYGFGQKTGVEIGESSGVQQTPDSLRLAGQTWVPGDYLRLSIGQMGAYTPIQLAAYAMMIANNGVRYETHFIKSIRSYDNRTETVIPAKVAAEISWSSEAIEQVKKGMIAVAKTGTAKNAFADAPYTVACKTGTAQTGVAGASDHGTFIAYAPAQNPEVAISVVIENGNSAAAASVAREVLDAYFRGKEAGEKPAPEGELIP